MKGNENDQCHCKVHQKVISKPYLFLIFFLFSLICNFLFNFMLAIVLPEFMNEERLNTRALSACILEIQDLLRVAVQVVKLKLWLSGVPVELNLFVLTKYRYFLTLLAGGSALGLFLEKYISFRILWEKNWFLDKYTILTTFQYLRVLWCLGCSGYIYFT